MIIIYNTGKGQLDASLEWIDRGIYANPEDPRIYLMKYHLLLKTEMTNWAESCLKQAKMLSKKYLKSSSISQEDKNEYIELLPKK